MDPDLSLREWKATQVVWDQPQTASASISRQKLMAARPLVRPAPRSAMVLPLVVLIAVLPGLAALNAWDLTPPGPMWGLRGLAVLDGLLIDQTPAADEIKPSQEAAAFRAVAYQPPLYAWLEALGFWLSAERDPLASVLPSYIAGALAVVVVYLHGRLWRGAGLGLTAAILVGFNQNLLLRMQEATPTTLAVAGLLATLLCYGWHERVMTESVRPWRWAGPLIWAIAGGVALGLAMMAFGGLALIAVPVVLLHQFYLRDIILVNTSRSGLVVQLAGPPELRRRLVGAGYRSGGFGTLARAYGCVAWLGRAGSNDGSSRRTIRRPAIQLVAATHRAGAGYAAAGSLWGSAGNSVRARGRIQHARDHWRLVLGNLAGGRGTDSGRLGERARERL